MKNISDSISEKKFIWITFPLITLIYLLLGLQGFDMCDEGWVITGYQQIFNDPASVQYLFLYYSSQFVGGIWNLLFGWGGIYSFRVLTAFTMTGAYYVVWLLLRKVINRNDFLIGVLIVMATNSTFYIVFHHNHFTSFLYCACAFLLYRAIIYKSYRIMFLCGIVMAVTFFARIPNLTLLALFTILIPFCVKNDFQIALKLFTSGLIGIIIGICLVLGIMAICGHFFLFISNLANGMSAVDDPESTHNAFSMIQTYLRQYYEIIKCSCLLLLPGLLLYFFKRKIHEELICRIVCCIVVVMYLVLISLIIYKNSIVAIYSFMTIWLLGSLVCSNKSNKITYLILISIVILYVLPLGSDGGIENMGPSCMLIATPLSVYLSRQYINKLIYPIIKLPYWLFIIFFILLGIKKTISSCYFDQGCRWAKTYKIESPLATTFTTKENKIALDELLKILPTYVSKDDCVLYFQSIATLHFLTETRPYLGNPWPWTLDPSNLERQLLKARNTHTELPVIVREKSMLPRWQTPYKDWNNDNAVTSFLHKNGRIKNINKFIKENNYKLVWENDLFQILIPSS